MARQSSTREEEQLRAVMAELERRGELPTPVDPIERLLDPGFTETLWYYPKSQVELWIPGNLHTKQVEALNSPEQFKWLFWGNQVGKTTLGAVECVLKALGRHPDGRTGPKLIWASALTWELWEQILLPELLTWIPPERLISAPPAKQQSTNRTIKILNDEGTVSRIVGKSAEQGAGRYQSARVDHVWLDEEHPEAIYNELQPRLLRKMGTLTGTMTPLLGLTWVFHRVYHRIDLGQLKGHFKSHAGLVDNPSISREAIERLKRELSHDPVQLASRVYGKFGVPAGIVLQLEPRHIEHTKLDALLDVAEKQKWERFCGVDFGYWRFAFVDLAADRARRVHVLEEYFSQKEDLRTRAEWIHEHLTATKAPPDTILWADSANPQDILELNIELEALKGPWRAVGVSKTSAEGMGYRRLGVDRIRKLMKRDAFLVREDLGEGRTWRLGQSAASEGRVQLGSRLRYEFGAWRYPKPKDEETAQKQDPDDNTADGADIIAAVRMAICSWWDAAEVELPEEDLDPFAAKVLEFMAKESRRVKPPSAKRKQSIDPLNTAELLE